MSNPSTSMRKRHAEPIPPWIAAKNPRLNRSALLMDALQEELTKVDETNTNSLIAFKRALEDLAYRVSDGSLVASSLSLDQVFHCFHLANKPITNFLGHSRIFFPQLIYSEGMSGTPPSEWLIATLKKLGACFGDIDETDRILLLKTILAEVLEAVHLKQKQGELESNSLSDSPSSGFFTKVEFVKGFPEVAASLPFRFEKSVLDIDEKIDIALCYTPTMLSQGKESCPDSIITVIEAKSFNMSHEKAVARLIGYMAMLNKVRSSKIALEATRPLGRPSSAIFGCLTDGVKFQFYLLEPDLVVSRSKILDFGKNNEACEILAHLRSGILYAAAGSPTTSSLQNTLQDTYPKLKDVPATRSNNQDSQKTQEAPCSNSCRIER